MPNVDLAAFARLSRSHFLQFKFSLSCSSRPFPSISRIPIPPPSLLFIAHVRYNFGTTCLATSVTTPRDFSDLPSFLHPYSFSHGLIAVVYPHLLKLSTELNSGSVQFPPFFLVCGVVSELGRSFSLHLSSHRLFDKVSR